MSWDFFIQLIIVDKFMLQYAFAILNSQLASWFYYWFVYNRAVRTMHFDKYYIDKRPVKDIDLKTQQPFIALVDEILSLKRKDPQADTSTLGAVNKLTSHFEALIACFQSMKLIDLIPLFIYSAIESQIDIMVYKLYELSYEEVKIIEPEFAMSEVEYEAVESRQ